jgi:hypothetical protein
MYHKAYKEEARRSTIKRFCKALYRMKDRVKTMTGDFTKDDIGSGYDIVFEAHAFSGDRDELKSLYRKVSDALNDDGLFISQTFTLNDDGTGPIGPLIEELWHYMTGHETHLLTNAELFDIFEEMGLFGE